MRILIEHLVRSILLGMLLINTSQAEIVNTWYVPDPTGNPIAALDEQGNVKWRKHYTPYGTELDQDATSERAARNNRIGYTGHVSDKTSGMVYMGARYYRPDLGRFMVMDPAAVDPEDPRTFSRYAYANNSPYMYTDPDGRTPALLWWVIGAGLMVGDVVVNDPVPGHEQDGIAPVITMPGPLRLGGKGAVEVGEQGSRVVTKGPKPRTNKLGPDPKAEGPHTQFKRDPNTGKVTGYTEFDGAGNPVKRFRGEGKPHGGTEPPFILEPKADKGPGSPPKVPRTPRSDELPKGY